MLGLKFCRICLDDNVRIHQILGSEVQDVYEKLINKKVQEEEGRLHNACYICYCQLKNYQQLVIKSQKSEELLKHILPMCSEMHLNTISFLDRRTYGLVNSLMVAEVESFQIQDNKDILKIENQSESDSNEMMVKDEPHNDSEFLINKIKLDEEHDFEQDTIDITENRKENTFETKTNLLANENKSFQIRCDGVFNNQLLIKDHEKPFICNECGEAYSTKALLIEHIGGHKPVNRKPNKRRDNLKIHTRTHTREKPYKCQYCSFTCAGSSNLTIHVRTHTGEKPFKCQFCSYTCVASSSIKKHMKIHTGEKPYKCQYCGYTCAHNSYLKAHVRIHTGERPFKCQYCICTFTQSSHLKVHIRTHTGEKPFKCQYCSYTSVVSGNLKAHIRTHTGEKPYKCPYCSYKSAKNGSLKDHIKTHKREKQICICKRKNATRDS